MIIRQFREHRGRIVWTRTCQVLLAALLLTSGTAAMASPEASAGTEQAPRQPVVFVHGLHGSPENFDTMIAGFEAEGYAPNRMVSFGYDSLGSLITSAEELKAEVDRLRQETGAQQVDIVSHSLGGLNSRWYVKFLGGQSAVDDWVSLGGPNHGGAPGTCPAPGSVACDQATQGSDFIAKLDSGDPTPGQVDYATFYSPCDGVVDSDWTILEGATNTDVGCVSHFDLVTDDAVRDQILDALAD